MKKILTTLTIIILLPLLGFGCNKMGAKVSGVVEDKILELDNQEMNYIKSNSKYQQIKRYIDTDGTEYWTDEYVSPDGSIGYQSYARKADGSLKSWGKGKEAQKLNHDWTSIVTTTL